MILHIDMDAFYASIEIRDNPALVGLPVVVGGSPKGRGVIAAASYAARKFGIHSAMPASTAIRLCPQAVFVKPRMEHYAAISRQIRAIFNDFTSLVEPLSLDEAFLDVSGCTGLFGDAVSIATQIRGRVKIEVGVTASAGVAPNKYLAKLASDLEKPDGLTIVDPNHVQEFLDPLDVSRVWGVGKQTRKKLESIGVRTIAQLRLLPLEVLKSKFGINSEHFWRLARGIDSRPVVPDRDAKSISHETTFASDIDDVLALHAWLMELTDQVARRMRRYGIVGKTLQLKLRYSDFETITRSQTISEQTNSTSVLSETATQLFAANSSEVGRGIRLLGVGVSGLGTGGHEQLPLFDKEESMRDKRMDQASDTIRDKFGSIALQRASSMAQGIHFRPDPDSKK